MPPVYTYPASIRFLYGLQAFGTKLGLRNISRLLKSLGHPERAYRCIHIAGSNGKGTTAALIASALTAAGYRTGLYTSPHVVDFTERIRVDGRPIGRREVASILALVRDEIIRSRSTFFEATTALAFEHFRRSGVEVAVLETGLGGRLDATNVVRPVVSVVTSIALEHEHILGRGLRRIAREKGGIIKQGVPCVVGDLAAVPDRVLRRIARERSASYRSLRTVRTRVLGETIAGTRFRLRGIEGLDGDYALSLVGKHQVRNAALALLVLDELNRSGTVSLSRRDVEEAFARHRRLSGLLARFQVLDGSPRIIVDVAHNPSAVRALVRTVERLRLPKFTVVFGLMRDKDLTPIARWIGRLASHVVAVEPRTDRACASRDIVQAFRKVGVPSTDGGPVVSGMRRALRRAGGGMVLVTGSHYVVGEMLAARWRKNYLTINQ